VNFFSNLTGKILIATPFSMEATIFHKSVIYLLHHDENSAFGFIINKKLEENLSGAIFKDLAKTGLETAKMKIHIGGPVGLSTGFCLHSSEYDKTTSLKPAQNQVAISSNTQILHDIHNNIGPKENLILLGYTKWAAKELEEEIKHNLWLVSEFNQKLIFGASQEDKWYEALDFIGVSANYFAPLLAYS
jgi:putative transcriptional regulator